ncbi:MAG TPA: hypothetical protein VG895_02820 [Patescibacteria group bacterium]|nr:hypothetical protein [Patescibacteria group bacterium]
MTEISNPCIESGCQAACCHDMWFQNIPLQKLPNLKKFFGEMTQIEYWDLGAESKRGVFYCISGDKILMHINKMCPKNKGLYCLGKNDPDRPQACDNMAFASNECSHIRNTRN